jgi:transmembrane sensor
MTPQDSDHIRIKEIILRFLEGIATDEEITILQTWLEENEANRQYFDEVNNTFQASVTLHRFNHPMVENAWEKVSQTIEQAPTLPASRIRKLYFPILKVAAAITLLIVTSALLFEVLRENNLHQRGIIVRNSEGNNTRILLPDSSTVWLNANSIIEYSSEFGKTFREVTLKGEAFFDVKKDDKAFIVRTDNMQVHVKGTRFNVEADKKNAFIKTTLEEGKVELHVEGSNEFYTMTPGDQIILNTQLNNVEVKKVDPSDFSAWKEEKLIFDNVPLGEIITKLENRYKVKITIKSLRAKHELLTMIIERETLDEVLEMIKLSSQLQVKVERNEIILYE